MTTWMERFREALTVMCGATPPEDLCVEWIQETSERLQEWVLFQEKTPHWAQGIVTIEAAMTWADTPAEGENHVSRPEVRNASVEDERGWYCFTPKNGGTPYTRNSGPDSWELRECHIAWVREKSTAAPE